jgi:hypothetical protein
VNFEQIEAVIDLSSLSKVELYDLLGRAEQLHRKLTAERNRRQTESTSSTRDTRDHVAVGVVTPGLIGRWPIMHFKDGQRVSITWFRGTLKDAYIKRNSLMANGGDFRVGTRKEDLWRYKHDQCRHPDATSGQRSRILQG